MVSVALKISDDFKSLIEKLPWINWSELAREESLERLRRGEAFKKFDELLKNSEMTDELASKFADELKKKVAKRHGL